VQETCVRAVQAIESLRPDSNGKVGCSRFYETSGSITATTRAAPKIVGLMWTRACGTRCGNIQRSHASLCEQSEREQVAKR